MQRKHGDAQMDNNDKNHSLRRRTNKPNGVKPYLEVFVDFVRKNPRNPEFMKEFESILREFENGDSIELRLEDKGKFS